MNMTLLGLRVIPCGMAGCCDSLPKWRESDSVNAPGHYERVWDAGWCQGEDDYEKKPAEVKAAERAAEKTAERAAKRVEKKEALRDQRTSWRRMGNGEYHAWMGNRVYAVVRSLVRHEYKRPSRKGRDVRYWIGGVAAQGIVHNSETGYAMVDVRGFEHGMEVKLLARAKRQALQEASFVGRALVDITTEHGVE